MIHSLALTHAIFEDVLPDPTSPDLIPPDAPHASGSRTPVQYYSSPQTEVRPIVSRRVAIGCGAASAALLLLFFAAGGLVAHFGLGSLMDPLLGSMATELSTMYTKDVAPVQQQRLGDEITRLRENIRSGKVPVAKLDPVMSALREAVSDQKITASEADKLARQIHDVNAPPAPKSQKPRK